MVFYREFPMGAPSRMSGQQCELLVTPESSFKQTSAKLPRPLSVESSVEPSDKLPAWSRAPQAVVAIKY